MRGFGDDAAHRDLAMTGVKAPAPGEVQGGLCGPRQGWADPLEVGAGVVAE
jgi:hypothetical protein